MFVKKNDYNDLCARAVGLARKTRDLSKENKALYEENRDLRHENEELREFKNKIISVITGKGTIVDKHDKIKELAVPDKQY